MYHHLYLPANETLLRMLSLDFLNKVAKRLNFHSTTVLLLDFLTKIKLHSTSLDSIRLTQQGGQTARFFLWFFVEWKTERKIEPFGQGLMRIHNGPSSKPVFDAFHIQRTMSPIIIVFVLTVTKMVTYRNIKTHQSDRNLIQLHVFFIRNMPIRNMRLKFGKN